ncbi:MAG TPA: C69 family dipeptidase [Bacteroidales bacterium]|nr:C69 family dipeptidase [Bacteroidales bacterium]
MKRLFLFVFLLSLPAAYGYVQAQGNGWNCFTIVAGKDATANGSVILAHNEDDHGKNLVNWFRVPRQQHEPGETITIATGAEVPQVSTTYAYVWLQMPGMKFADSYMNEHGVIIASNACASREDDPELTDGGIGYWLRRLMAERASTAQEAVEVAGELIEKYGYASSGRTYSVADNNEAWVMSVVNGKHWVAQRVPDDEVMLIPNYYTIKAVNLSNEEVFMGSDNLIGYAQKRGWYQPEKDGAFNFRKAYGHPRTLASDGNIPRKWRGLELITGRDYEMEASFPFSVKPGEKLDVRDFMQVLSDHYEGTEWDESQDYRNGEPHHHGVNSLCAPHNQYGFVTELRQDMPVEIGTVMWLAPRRPCIQPYVPWYLGMQEMPEGFARTNYQTALENHFKAPENMYEAAPDHAFVQYARFANRVDEQYGELIGEISSFKQNTQKQMFEERKERETQAMELYKKDKQAAQNLLSEFTLKYLEKTREFMESIK